MPGGACGYLLWYDVDPGISVDHDAIDEINKMFKPQITYKNNNRFNCFILYAKGDNRITVTYEYEFDNFRIYYSLRAPEYNHLFKISIPPNRFGLTKNEVESYWEMLDFLEKEGSMYDKQHGDDDMYARYVYDFPPPEKRQKLLDLLKKVYSMSLTKACK